MIAKLIGLKASPSAPVKRTQTKESAVAGIETAFGGGTVQYMDRKPEAFLKEGYLGNPIVHACINMIARSIAYAPVVVMDGDKELDGHPALDLLNRPNPMMRSRTEFLEAAATDLLGTGNIYVERILAGGGKPVELWRQNPIQMKIKPGRFIVPSEYVINVAGKNTHWPVDPLTGESDIMHVKLFNPLDPFYGLSPIQAAALSIDNHTETSQWWFKLLKRGMLMSGLLTHKPGDDEEAMTPEQTAKLEDRFAQQWAGGHGERSGGVKVASGDFSFTNMSDSGKQLPFDKAKHLSAGEIAVVFGVPGQLIGIPDQQTYANNREARLSFWLNTVVPTAERVLNELSAWLMPAFGSESLRFAIDLDNVEALQPMRERKWERIVKSVDTLLTLNEARAELGFDPVEGGDEILRPLTVAPITFAVEDPSDNPDNAKPPTDPEKGLRIAYGG